MTPGDDSGDTTTPEPKPAVGIVASQKTASMKVGDTKTITVTTDPTDADDSAVVIAATKWTSSDTAIATVSADGIIAAVAAGAATITGTSGAFTASVAVTVTAVEA